MNANKKNNSHISYIKLCFVHSVFDIISPQFEPNALIKMLHHYYCNVHLCTFIVYIVKLKEMKLINIYFSEIKFLEKNSMYSVNFLNCPFGNIVLSSNFAYIYARF